MPLRASLSTEESRARGRNELTPVWTTNYCIVPNRPRSRTTGDAEIRELDTSVLVSQDVGTLDIPVDDTLVVEVYKSFKNLGYVDSNQSFRKFPEPLADIVERTVLTKPVYVSILQE